MKFKEYWKKSDVGKNCFYVYILKLSNGEFYIGQTFNVEHRVLQHLKGKGAVITKKNRPVETVSVEKYSTRYEAWKREIELRKEYRHLLSK